MRRSVGAAIAAAPHVRHAATTRLHASPLRVSALTAAQISPSMTSRSSHQRRLKSTQPSARKKSAPSFQSSHGRALPDNVVAQINKMISRANARASSQADAAPDLEFLRHATSVLQAAQSQEQLRAALPLCRIVEHADTFHGSAIAECVRIYEALGRPRDAVELALRLLRHDFFLRNPVLASALRACAALRDADRGFELFTLACERGTIPNRNVFGALLALSAVAGDAPMAPRVVELLRRMEQTDTEMNHTTFHHWMASFAKMGHYEQVDELFETIESYGLAPVAATYAIQMDAYAEQGDYDKTMALFKQLQRDAEASDSDGDGGVRVGLVHYNVALKACGKNSKLTQAFHLYEEMKSKQIAPDLVTYITMMHAVYHGELGVVDTRKVKAAMGGVGAVALASVPFIDLQEQLMTVLFCSSLVGSMGLAVYMNPDGAMRALYPNSDEPHHDSVIEAFFRRLREEDHSGRSMYLWREMLKLGVAPDSRVYDVLVRSCVKKRHPELAFEAVFEQQGVALVDADSGHFVLPLPTTVSFLHSLLAQRRLPMADTVFDQARAHRAFRDIFREGKDVYSYDLRTFNTPQVRSYVMRRLLTQLHGESKLFGSGKAQLLPRVEFLVLHGFDLLDQLDMDDAQMRELFAMDEMKRETTPSGGSGGQFFFRLNIPRERLAAFFSAPLASATQQKL